MLKLPMEQPANMLAIDEKSAQLKIDAYHNHKFTKLAPLNQPNGAHHPLLNATRKKD